MDMEAESVLYDIGVVSIIVGNLVQNRDRRNAALVCRAWNEALRFSTRIVSIRTRACISQLAVRFQHIFALDLSGCFDTLTDSDLSVVAGSLRNLKSLKIGSLLRVQDAVTDSGLEYIASSCCSLEDLTLIKLPNVQDRGIQALASSLKLLVRIALEGCERITDNALESLAGMPNLRSVCLRGNVSFTTSGLSSFLGACKGLEKLLLDLGYMEIDPALKCVSTSCSNIKELELHFKTATLSSLSNCTSLRSISIYTDQVSSIDWAVSAIVESNSRNLLNFSFANPCSPLEDATVLGIIIKCPRLRKLHINGDFVFDTTVASVCHLWDLEHLGLENYHGSAWGLWMHGRGLSHLSFKMSRGIRDREIESLAGKHLVHLDLQGCTGLSSFGFSAIGMCRNLVHLDLSFTEVDDLSLLEISSGVKGLESLNVAKCERISSASVIASFPNLGSLTLNQCPFMTDEGLHIIVQHCPHLHYLSLSFTSVTDVGLCWLAELEELKVLNVPYCRGISGDGVTGILKPFKIQMITMSHRLRSSKPVLNALEDNCCFAKFEVDDMALIPFGY